METIRNNKKPLETILKAVKVNHWKRYLLVTNGSDPLITDGRDELITTICSIIRSTNNNQLII